MGIRHNVLQEIESRTWDWRLRAISGGLTPDPDIKLIVVDQSSLDHFAKEEKIFWPWPRALYVPVVEFLEKAGARGVAFDLLFTESSSYGVEDDATFAAALNGALPVIVALAPQNASPQASAQVLEELTHKQSTSSVPTDLKELLSIQAERDASSSYSTVLAPIPELRKVSRAFGSVSTAPDSDGVFRHAKIGARVGSLEFLSLPFSLYAVTAAGEHSLERDLNDAQGRLTLRFLGPARTFRTYPIAAVIKSFQAMENGEKPLIDPEEFRNSLVLVGVDAPALLDLRPTPLAAIFSGVEYNATVLDNIRNNRFIRKSSTVATVGISSVFIFFSAAALVSISSALGAILAAAVVLCGFVALTFSAALYGWWLPLVSPFLACVGSGLAALGFQLQLEGRQRRFIRNAFRYYVNDSVIERAIKDPASLSLGGERRRLTLFFSDIEGFTATSEKMEPAKLVALLNLFLTEMTRIIMRLNGTVDKYVGDAVVAFWNAPLADEAHELHAVMAALECQRRIQELKPRFMEEFGAEIRVRIGIHTGLVSVGNFGSEERFNYTVVGDTANLASRIEGVNKIFGTYTLVSEDTRRAIGDKLHFRRIGAVQVLGRALPVTLFEPLNRELINRDSIDPLDTQFEEALHLAEQGRLEEALEIFKSLPTSKLILAYIERIQSFMRSGAALSSWSAVFQLDQK